MNERILLASYSIKIKYKKEDAYLSAFNSVDDFYPFLKKFFEYIFVNLNQLKDRSGNNTIYLTLDELPVYDDTSRICHGYLSSGISGDNYKVKEIATNKVIIDVDREFHGSFRDVFFYFAIPYNKSQGFLILQRKTHFGIKTKLLPALNGFLSKEGYTENTLSLNNIIHSSVYEQMMTLGKLKKVELIRNRIPNNLEDYLNNDENCEQTKGILKTSFTSGTSLPDSWKTSIDQILRRERNETIEIDGLDDSYTDLEFQLELNGKQKTFYIRNEQRVQPDIDVSSNVEFIKGVPTTESLVKNAVEIIDEIIKISPKNV